jgi:hypothetical protein
MDGTTNRRFREESFYEEGNIGYIMPISGNSAFLRKARLRTPDFSGILSRAFCFHVIFSPHLGFMRQ